MKLLIRNGRPHNIKKILNQTLLINHASKYFQKILQLLQKFQFVGNLYIPKLMLFNIH